MDMRVVTIDYVPGAVDIANHPPRFRTQRDDAKVEVDQPRHDFDVDASAFRSVMGYGGVLEEGSKRRQQALADGEAATMEMAREGNRIGHIETGAGGVTAIAQVAAEELEETDPDVNVAPPPLLQIEYSGKPGAVGVSDGKIRTRFEVQPPEVEYRPAEVQVDTEVRHVNVSV